MEFSRRKFLAALAGAAVCPAGYSREQESLTSATGTAFGTEVGVAVFPQPGSATAMLDLAFSVIEKHERIFTLYDPASPLRRLNDTGELRDPPSELLELLACCDHLHGITNGAFDPTVQPLWELYESHFARNPLDTAGPSPRAIAETRKLIGWKAVVIDSAGIRFRKPGVKLTLNGVAPGFTADAVADALQAGGVAHGLIDCGEFRALGVQPDGAPWPVAIRGPGDETPANVPPALLNGSAAATSAGYATVFDLARRYHHLFDPKAPDFQPADRVIVVEAPTAVMADGLATAGGIINWNEFREIIRPLPGVRARRILPAQ